uniref:Uncharacterized protein n=1 Tax=Arundo donax TaxID=35708 RepID=A0A0A9C095_ARUDO
MARAGAELCRRPRMSLPHRRLDPAPRCPDPVSAALGVAVTAAAAGGRVEVCSTGRRASTCSCRAGVVRLPRTSACAACLLSEHRSTRRTSPSVSRQICCSADRALLPPASLLQDSEPPSCGKLLYLLKEVLLKEEK